MISNSSDCRHRQAEIFWGEIAPCEHSVQIYDEDGAFLDCLAGYVSGGLTAGEAVVIIAKPAHLHSLEFRLRAKGMNLPAAGMKGQYFSFDAEESLSKFMVQGWPDEGLFKQFVDSLLSRARGKSNRRVRAFGEMVAILWAEGHHGATVRLEHLWHQLCQEADLSLFCAYPKAGFTQDADTSIRAICDAHSKVIAA